MNYYIIYYPLQKLLRSLSQLIFSKDHLQLFYNYLRYPGDRKWKSCRNKVKILKFLYIFLELTKIPNKKY